MFITVKLPNEEFVSKGFDKSTVLIGSDESCDLVLPDESIASKHCIIERHDEHFFILDLGSEHGVYIEDQKIPRNHKKPYDPDLPLKLADLECTILPNIFDEEKPKISKMTYISKLVGLTGLLKKAPLNLQLEKPRAHGHREMPVYFNKSFKPPKPQATHRKDKKLVEKSEASLKLIPVGIGLVLIIGTSHFLFNGQSPLTFLKKFSFLNSNKAAQFTEVKDVFYEEIGYSQKKLEGTGDNHQFLRKELALIRPGESISIVGNEVFIFMDHTKILNIPRVAKLANAEEMAKILAIRQVLRSQLLAALQNKKYQQLHLLLTDSHANLLYAFRFHEKYFSEDGLNRMRLQAVLKESLKHKKENLFWEKASAFIPSHTF